MVHFVGAHQTFLLLVTVHEGISKLAAKYQEQQLPQGVLLIKGSMAAEAQKSKLSEGLRQLVLPLITMIASEDLAMLCTHNPAASELTTDVGSWWIFGKAFHSL